MNQLKEAKRIVVKVGTSTLTHGTGKTNLRIVGRLAAVLSDLHNSGREVVLVSSGALALGMNKLALRQRPREISQRQAAAAVGQGELMFLYDKYFGEFGITVGQLLLTCGDFTQKTRRQNLLNTFSKLLEMGAVPIVNENDSVSTDELEGLHIGDNDNLSALVARLIGADALIFFTDTDGLYTANPMDDERAMLVPVVPRVTEDILALGGKSRGSRGTGGMITKLEAAKVATEAGIDAVIMNGGMPENLYQLMDGRQVGTWFRRQQTQGKEQEGFGGN
ncbi:MAG: glutamate 5-kinase [Oscillospiraceae bacterium]|jgi:glutamate 5-kinase|nr:glutamate 5-kinase [Oscillospiraceae bacterium]